MYFGRAGLLNLTLRYFGLCPKKKQKKGDINETQVFIIHIGGKCFKLWHHVVCSLYQRCIPTNTAKWSQKSLKFLAMHIEVCKHEYVWYFRPQCVFSCFLWCPINTRMVKLGLNLLARKKERDKERERVLDSYLMHVCISGHWLKVCTLEVLVDKQDRNSIFFHALGKIFPISLLNRFHSLTQEEWLPHSQALKRREDTSSAFV